MYLEFLSNELFLDIFEYLSAVHLLRAFYDLNIRLNNLLYLHFKIHSFNFQSSSKYNFDLICHQYLPFITDRIYSLRLSDDDDTPNQIDLFFSYGLSFQQFSHLQSLSINRIYSLNSMKLLINQLISLPHLIHLSITRYFILYNEEYDMNMIGCIGRLSKLISCHLDITTDSEFYFSIPSIRSLSLKYLSLPYLDCTIKQLVTLIQYIPNLQSLTTSLTDFLKVLIRPVIVFSSIKIFKLNLHGSFHAMRSLLETMPNLEELKIEMISSYIDGYQWENLIENTLPNLIIFQLKMSFSLSTQKSREKQIDEILNSFSNQFWIDNHQWFIQCYWTPMGTCLTAYVYTLPYAFRNFLYHDNGQFKSTYSNTDHFFNHVHNLYYGSTNSSLSPIHFNNIRYLDLTIPFNDSLWSILTKFDRLKSLKIVLINQMNEINQLKLQILFDHVPHLYSFTFYSWSIENIFPFELKNSSIRQLDLRAPNIFYNHQQCQQLSQSSIVQQCQILFINLQQRIDVLNLINQLNHLNVLIVKCQRSEMNENLTEWLEQYSLLTFTTSDYEEIRLWIR